MRAAQVSEVLVAQGGDEVVHQSQLGGLPVDIQWHEEQASFGTQHGVRGQQVLAGAAFGAQHGVGRHGEQSQAQQQQLHGYAPTGIRAQRKTG